MQVWRHAPGTVGLLLAVVLFAVFSSGSAVIAGDAADDDMLSEILVNMQQANSRFPDKASFTQRVALRVLLFRWNFSSYVQKDATVFDVHVDGAPSFVPEGIMLELVNLTHMLGDFDLQFIGRETAGSSNFVKIEGVRKSHLNQGALRTKIWINEDTWFVDKAEIVYDWGTLTVHQHYKLVDGFMVLDRQNAVGGPMNLRLEVAYTDYRFAERGHD